MKDAANPFRLGGMIDEKPGRFGDGRKWAIKNRILYVPCLAGIALDAWIALLLVVNRGGGTVVKMGVFYGTYDWMLGSTAVFLLTFGAIFARVFLALGPVRADWNTRLGEFFLVGVWTILVVVMWWAFFRFTR